jgi:ATP-dependent Clp protease ATP-binding subunit ClpA
MTYHQTNRRSPGRGLREALVTRLVGQPEAIHSVVPYIQMYEAGLAPEGRPAGVFLLLGPTGTGKTKTVESIAEVLHGSEKRMLKIDCGEFQLEHEVAKLLGAPPGYLGHRETQPLLSQAKLNSATSESSSLAIVLFDEVEKAAPSLTRLLLGVFDKATLRLGDNTTVNFERTLIFLTSNLGAKEMARASHPEFGFEAMVPREDRMVREKIEAIGTGAMRRRFSPEFINRIDRVIAFQPLDEPALERILDAQLAAFGDLIASRLGPRVFSYQVDQAARRFLLDRGTSAEYGARELKRVLHRHVFQPIATLLSEGSIPPAAAVRISHQQDASKLRFRIQRKKQMEPWESSLDAA